MNEKLLVKIGCGVVLARDGTPRLMTRKQAMRHAQHAMDPILKRVGFEAFVARSDAAMHGGDWFRINYGKRV